MNFDLPPTKLEGDSVDGSTAAAKKDNIMERLNKRNKDRQNYLDVKLEQRSKEQLQLEGADYFASTFADRVREIELLIANISDAAASSSETVASADLTRLFADITVEIQELQRYLTSSTMFLMDYKIKACQNILNDLNTSSEENRLRLLPKKKFGFSGKKVTPKTVVNPKLSAATDRADASEKSGLGTSNSRFTWTLSHRNGEHICLRGDDVNGKDVTISNLSNCLVELQGHAGSVQISNATDCTFLCGPIARSLFAEHCQNTTMALACQQLRLHSSSTIRIYMHVTCRAIIEDCKQIEIAAFNYDYPTIETDFQLAGLEKTHNNYTDVADFNWLSPDVPSPNWRLLKDSADPNWNQFIAAFKAKLVDNVAL